MALTPKVATDPNTRLFADALAFGLPLACYLATASSQGYWLDAGEFVAAAGELGFSHPPGHPVESVLGAAVSLVPLGAL
ncbi:MAG: DUF2723 domain-containing protein, partial [Myxococcota bacterium]